MTCPSSPNWRAASQNKHQMTARLWPRVGRRTGASEAYGQPQNRPMLHHIEFVSVEAGTFFKIHAQGTVPQQASVGDTIANGEGEAVGAKHIRWELAAGVEATRIGPGTPTPDPGPIDGEL